MTKRGDRAGLLALAGACVACCAPLLIGAAVAVPPVLIAGAAVATAGAGAAAVLRRRRTSRRLEHAPSTENSENLRPQLDLDEQSPSGRA